MPAVRGAKAEVVRRLCPATPGDMVQRAMADGWMEGVVLLRQGYGGLWCRVREAVVVRGGT